MPAKKPDNKRPSALGLDEYLPTEGPGRDDMMQLFAWTFEDALNAQEEWEDRYGPNVRGRGPFFRWLGANELRELYEAYRSGDSTAIIEALYVCSLNSLPIPRWCEGAFLGSYRKVRHYKENSCGEFYSSWDDVFGRPHPKGAHLEAKRKEREKSLLVYTRIKKIKEKDPSIPLVSNRSCTGLFRSVGKDLGIGETLTEEYYYKWKNYFKS